MRRAGLFGLWLILGQAALAALLALPALPLGGPQGGVPGTGIAHAAEGGD